MPKYREDSDLEVLKIADNQMLGILVEYLTQNRDGDKWLTEQLTSNPEFIAANGDYQKVWQLIAEELQLFGGNTIANMIRGKGVLYREILIDVCEKVKVKTDYNVPIVEIENALIAKIFANSWDAMTSDERNELKKDLKLDPTQDDALTLEAIKTGIAKGYFSYQVSMLIASSFANAVLGTNIALLAGFAGAVGASRLIGSLAGPLGVLITSMLTLPMISGPAYRVTLPAVIQVAAIRQQLLNREGISEKAAQEK